MIAPADRLVHSEVDENKMCKRLLKGNFPRPAQTEPTPLSILQYWDTTIIPPDVIKCIKTWEPLIEQGFIHRIYNDFTAKSFIAEYYSSRYLTAYEACHHPAMRCDYFRLAYLFVNGGIYSDIDNILLDPHRIMEIVSKNHSLNLVPLFHDKALTPSVMLDEAKALDDIDDPLILTYFNNDPIFCSPRNPVLRLALDRATTLILEDKASGVQ